MIAVPLIYFTILSYYLYRRKREFDLAVIISMIYAVSGFFSVLMEVFNIRTNDTLGYQVTLFPTIVYCGLLTMCLMPFIRFGNRCILEIKPVRDVWALKILAWASCFWFIIYAVLSLSVFIVVVTGDMAEMRSAIYLGEGNDNFMIFLPQYIRMPLSLFNTIFGCYWIFLFLAFFCLLIQRLPMKYFWMFIIASLSGPWIGVLQVDRSRSTYWIVSFIIIFLFYYPFMSAKLRRKISVLMLVLVGMVVIYISVMTSSRFGERDYGQVGGSEGGVILYLGQNFINFCYFFDTFNCHWTTLSLIFPFTNKYILGEDIVGGVIIQEYLSLLTGKQVGVFYTFIGHIMVTAGKVVAILWCVVYTILAYYMLGKIKRRKVSLHIAYLYMLFASVMFLGEWVFFYSAPPLTFSALCFLVLTKMMGVKSGSYLHTRRMLLQQHFKD